MFASKITKVVTLPMDETVTVTIRKLSWLQRKEARKASVNASARDLAAMGGAETIAALSKTFETGEAKKDEAPADVDPLALYDQLTVLKAGIAAWSVSDKVTPDMVADLDEDVAEFLAREILALSLPVMSEADRKNAD